MRNLAAAAVAVGVGVALGLWGSATIASAQAEAVIGLENQAVCVVNSTVFSTQALAVPGCLGQTETLNQLASQLG